MLNWLKRKLINWLDDPTDFTNADMVERVEFDPGTAQLTEQYRELRITRRFGRVVYIGERLSRVVHQAHFIHE